ncbi:phage tail tape measure protein [Photobacterium sp. Hal280]|uniref:phage tail tape measure protein n=1 Tax=Photobacterium sp. Hal280 TaxID=3035163 RepID=UPI00301CEBDB
MNEKLLMQIGLIDQITKPLQGITKQVQSTMNAGKQGMQDMAVGGAGLVASGFAIQEALMPAIEMDRKIGEVKSLGVTDDALKQLTQTAFEFSSEYGKSATDFVAASYDIQSAIAGLDGNELSQFTKASGVLAAATKADTSTITSYMGTMYGIFKNQAEEMGKGEWVEQVAGMTASAVQMFKTTGNEMSAAFTSVGANATSAGIAMSEQMAILGTLQATMSGSEAGTKYKAFLAGVGTAQDKLNLKFTDAQGNMLPMLDILDKLKGKFGDTLEVTESDALKKAFGSEEAVSLIKLLMADTQGLAGSIEALGQVKGMTKAEEMAGAMTDQWERLEASWFAVRAAVFGAILPSINAVVGSMADGMVYLTGWTAEFPFLTEVLGYVAIGALALGGVVASLSLVMGIARMMSAGWAVTTGTLNGVLKLLRINTMAMTAATWLMNAALWANPITWVIAGIVALVAAVGAMIYWWDDLKAAFGDTAVFKFLSDTIDWVIDKLNMIPGIDIEWRAGEMPEAPAMKAVEQVEKATPPAIATLPDAATYQVQHPAMTAAPLPGQVSADDMPTAIQYKRPENTPSVPPSMVQSMTSPTPPQTSNIRQYGDVYIDAPNGMTPDQLAEWDELNAG